MPDLTGDAERSRTAKIALRSQLLTARRQAPSSAATLLQDQVLAFVRSEHPSTIAAYVPIGTEPGGPGLITALAAEARVLLPVLRPDNDLDWAEYSGSLESGPHGLLSPPGPRLGVSGIGEAGLVLVPALAVDRRGLRLGRGGGSYDRALSRVSSGALVVALLHDGELLAEVPAEPHDRPVHGVITPHGGLFLTRK
ncbi:5-formyltetrahydrofolate cyclo-ligase [Actinoplanes sp. NPDC000266]